MEPATSTLHQCRPRGGLGTGLISASLLAASFSLKLKKEWRAQRPASRPGSSPSQHPGRGVPTASLQQEKLW